jgi:hypothetical protein
MAASGIGALAGALLTASLGNFAHKGMLLILVTLTLGATLIGFSSSHWLPVSLALVVLVGGTSTLMMSLANALLQGLVSGEMRGRVMSVYTLIAGGFMPLGSMLLGTTGEVIGVPLAVGLGGVITVAIAIAAFQMLGEVRATT